MRHYNVTELLILNAYAVYQEIPERSAVPVELCQHIPGGTSTNNAVPLMVGKVRREVADELGSGFTLGLENGHNIKANKAKRF